MDDQTGVHPLGGRIGREAGLPRQQLLGQRPPAPHRSSRAFLATWYRSPEKTVSSKGRGWLALHPHPWKLLVATTKSFQVRFQNLHPLASCTPPPPSDRPGPPRVRSDWRKWSAGPIPPPPPPGTVEHLSTDSGWGCPPQPRAASPWGRSRSAHRQEPWQLTPSSILGGGALFPTAFPSVRCSCFHWWVPAPRQNRCSVKTTPSGPR